MRWQSFQHVQQSLANQGISVENEAALNALVQKWYNAGLSLRDIGTRLGVRQRTVGMHLEDLGVARRGLGGPNNRLYAAHTMVTHNGETLHTGDWAKRQEVWALGLNQRDLYRRKCVGWPDAKILTTPKKGYIGKT